MFHVRYIVLSVIVVITLLCRPSWSEHSIAVLMLNTTHDPLPTEQAVHLQDISGKVFIKGNFYEGSLKILKDSNGLHIINTIPLETYVEKVVAAETEKNWELEALKAQAVISRTYATFYKQLNSGQQYNIASTALNSSEDNRIDPLILYAATVTKGEILTYDDSPIKALHHSACEGKTELPEELWKESYPYLQSVTCNSRNSPFDNWEKSFTRDKIAKAFGVEMVRDLEISSYTSTGRVKYLRLLLPQEKPAISSTIVSALELRKRLGEQELPSTSFSLSSDTDTITFIGHGSGHGVGLSMWGALEMAKQGMNYQQILSHYYPGTTLKSDPKQDHHKFVSR